MNGTEIILSRLLGRGAVRVASSRGGHRAAAATCRSRILVLRPSTTPRDPDGLPEVIFGPGKTTKKLSPLVQPAGEDSNVLATRTTRGLCAVKEQFPEAEYFPRSGALRVSATGRSRQGPAGGDQRRHDRPAGGGRSGGDRRDYGQRGGAGGRTSEWRASTVYSATSTRSSRRA